MGRTGCCGHCDTVYRVDSTGKILWSADFFLDSPQILLANTPATGLLALDEDGNVYQPGSATQVIVPLGNPQEPMYTLRSWDKDGALRWSWSEAIQGTTARTPPARLLSCRYGKLGTNKVLFVSDDSRETLNGKTYITCLNCRDATQAWRQPYEADCHIAGYGKDRLLLRRSNQYGYFGILFGGKGFFTVHKVTGNVTSKVDGVVVAPYNYGGRDETVVIDAVIDDSDTVYALVSHEQFFDFGYVTATSRDFYSDGIYYGIAIYPKDQSYPLQVIPTLNFQFLPAAYVRGSDTNCYGKLGMARQILLSPTKLIVVGDLGYEVFNRSDLKSVQTVCFSVNRIFRAQGLPIFWMFYFDDTQIAATHSTLQASFSPSIMSANGDEKKMWTADQPFDKRFPLPAVHFPMVDAITDANGGGVWGQIRVCDKHLIKDETRTFSRTCPTVCCPKGFQFEFPETATGDVYKWNNPDDVSQGYTYWGTETFQWHNEDQSFGLGKLTNHANGLCPVIAQGGYFCAAANTVFNYLVGVQSNKINSNFAVYLNYDMKTGKAVIRFQWRLIARDATLAKYGYEFNPSIALPDPPYQVPGIFACWWAPYYKCDDFTCDGGTFALDWNTTIGGNTSLPGPPGFLPSQLSVTPMDYSGKDAGKNLCLGYTDWIAVDDNRDGWTWAQNGVSHCSPSLKCGAIRPVVNPRYLGDVAQTLCR